MIKPIYCPNKKIECKKCRYKGRCKFYKSNDLERNIILGVQTTL